MAELYRSPGLDLIDHQVLAELTEERAAQVPDLAGLNRLFAAWTETVYHVREHSETGQAPGPPRVSRTGIRRLFHAASWLFRYSSRTSCGVL